MASKYGIPVGWAACFMFMPPGWSQEIGRSVIERAQGYYDSRALWQQAVQEHFATIKTDRDPTDLPKRLTTSDYPGSCSLQKSWDFWRFPPCGDMRRAVNSVFSVTGGRALFCYRLCRYT